MAKQLQEADNYYRSWRHFPVLVVRLDADRLEGPLQAMAIYCLRYLNRRVGRINPERLAQLYMVERPGLLSECYPSRMTVQLKPFRAWIRHNYKSFEMTEQDLRLERRARLMRLIDDYARNGDHFWDGRDPFSARPGYGCS